MEDVLVSITEKLIRRHPHVFGSVKLESVDEVTAQWEAIKKLEKGKSSRVSALDDIPKELPALAKAQKMAAKFSKLNFGESTHKSENAIPRFDNEDELGALLYAIVKEANEKELNPTHALLKQLTLFEKEFRANELQT